jgi:hypothetical protein
MFPTCFLSTDYYFNQSYGILNYTTTNMSTLLMRNSFDILFELITLVQLFDSIIILQKNWGTKVLNYTFIFIKNNYYKTILLH